MAMDNVNPAEVDKLFENIPWEAWKQVTATDYSWQFTSTGIVYTGKKEKLTKRFARRFLSLFDWNKNDGWTLKRKNE